MNVGVVLVAAGQGARLGSHQPKALVTVHGTPIVTHAALGVLSCPEVSDLVVVAPPGWVAETTAAVRRAAGAGPQGSSARVAVVPGGSQRSESVALGLAAMPDDVGIVLVHDAARALTPADVFTRVVHAVREGHAAVVPALPVADTIKGVAIDEHGDAHVTHTLERVALRAVQTPQGFLRETLERAHAQPTGAGRSGGAGQPAGVEPVTDDAGLVEQAGGRVHVVPGDPRALKITTPGDLRVAAALATPTAQARQPVLLVLGGLPGVGKTTIAREWAAARGAAHVRIDTIEQALVRGGVHHDLGPLGYAAAYEVAADQLRLGLDVVADSVNPVEATRHAWRQIGWRTGAHVVEVEVACADSTEHRRRVGGRAPDIPGHRVPGWPQVQARDYEPWPAAALRVDTQGKDVAVAVREIEELIG